MTVNELGTRRVTIADGTAYERASFGMPQAADCVGVHRVTTSAFDREHQFRVEVVAPLCVQTETVATRAQTEHQTGRNVPDAPTTRRHPTKGAPDALPVTRVPVVLDELVPGAWESDGGRTVPIRQEQPLERAHSDREEDHAEYTESAGEECADAHRRRDQAGDLHPRAIGASGAIGAAQGRGHLADEAGLPELRCLDDPRDAGR